MHAVTAPRACFVCTCGFTAIGEDADDRTWMAAAVIAHQPFCPGPKPRGKSQHGTPTAAPQEGAPGTPSPAGPPPPSPPGPAGDPPT